MKQFEKKLNRRDFFRACVRNLMLGIITCSSFVLIFKKRETSQSQCVNHFICDGCRIYYRCNLHHAVMDKKQKQDQKKK